MPGYTDKNSKPDTSGMKKPSLPPLYAVEVVSRCVDSYDYGETKCDAIYYADGTLRGGCADPCSFIMKKAGSGEPPFLHPEAITEEIEKLMLRKSRGGFKRA